VKVHVISLLLAGVLALLAAAAEWRSAAPIPTPRSEVAVASVGGEVVVVGGFLENGSSSAVVEAYSPARDRWRRLPDLPVEVNHPMAAAAGGRLYVLGGYGGPLIGARRDAFVLDGGAWRRLPRLPAPRAAGGAAIVGGKLYVVGGVVDRGRLARDTFVLDLQTRRWSVAPGPTPREHLAVTAARGRVYALAGRTAGFDTNLRLLEAWSPSARRWQRLPPVPEARGGTGAAALAGTIVSVGGEAPSGTIASVYGYDVADRRWLRLPDLPTPRHGLAVVALGDRIYAVAGGTVPGLSVSAANEVLSLP
jgi:N-acetylneuraminic acid mutarotase